MMSPTLIPTRNSNSMLPRGQRVSFLHTLLHLNGTPHGIDNALKLSQHAISCVLDHSAAVLADFGVHKCIQMLFEPRMCPLLIGAR